MRFPALVLLIVLAGCGRFASDVSALQPGIDVAQASLRGGAPQSALKITDDILAHHPSNEAALVVQGDAYTMLGRLSDAADSYTRALKVNSQSVGAEIGLGRIRLASDPASAEALFLDALQIEPRSTTALNDLGVARDLQGRHAEAQVAYRKALGIDPELSAAQVNLALSMAMSGSADEAVKILRPMASDAGASRKMRHDLAAALTMAGDRDAAAHILSADLSPTDVRQALDAYAAARAGGGNIALASTPHGEDAAVGAKPVPIPLPERPSGADAAQAQLAAAASQDSAQQEWQRLQERMPNLLASHQPEFIKAESNGHEVWRVRTGFADMSQANAFCDKVRAAGGPCMVIKP